MPKALTELATKEVSLVMRGAVNRRFALKKEATAMDQILKAVLEQEADGETAALAALEKSDISVKGREAMKGIIRLYSAFRDEIPADVAKAAPKMAGYEVKPKKDKGPDEDPHEPTDDDDEYTPEMKKGKAKKGKPFGQSEPDGDEAADDDEDKKFPPSQKKKDKTMKAADLPAEFRAHFEHVTKAQQAAVAKAQELEKALFIERDVRLTKEYVEKAAKEFATLGPAQDVGAVLKALHGADSDLANKVEKLLKNAAERANQAALFGERGRDASLAHGAGNSAWNRIQKAAEELVNKSSDSKLSKEMAVDLVMRRNPELYNEYIAERQQGGR